MQITNACRQALTFGQHFLTTVKSDRNVQFGLLALAAISLVGIIFLVLRSRSSSEQMAKDKRIDHLPSEKLKPSQETKSQGLTLKKLTGEDKQIVKNQEESIAQKNQDIPVGKIILALHPVVELIPFAEGRKGKMAGDFPQSDYFDNVFDLASAKKDKDKKKEAELQKRKVVLEDTILDPDKHKKHVTALFAACFHTSESHEEIYQLLINIRNKLKPIKPDEEFPLANLFDNLTQLLDALPLEKYPLMKIYWSQSVEDELIPHLIKTDDFEPKNLLLAYVSGEKILSPYQAANIDFNRQFQFVSVNYNQFLKSFNMVMDELANLVYSSDWKEAKLIDKAVMKEMVSERYNASVNQNKLVNRANFFTFRWNAYHHLSEMKRNKQQIFFDALDKESKIKHLRALYSPPTKILTNE